VLLEVDDVLIELEVDKEVLEVDKLVEVEIDDDVELEVELDVEDELELWLVVVAPEPLNSNNNDTFYPIISFYRLTDWHSSDRAISYPLFL
jgi:hypothetical protein